MVDLHPAQGPRLILQLSPRDKELTVRVVESPVGESREEAVVLQRLEDMQRAASQPTFFEAVGRGLFRALLPGQLAEMYRAACAQANAAESPLTLELRFDRELTHAAQYPWELLHDGSRFPLQAGAVNLVRYLSFPEPARPLTTRRPFEILVVSARPKDQPPLASEFAALERAFQPLIEEDRLDLAYLLPPTWDALMDWLLAGAPSVLHFEGHGAFTNTGLLVFENIDGESDPVDAQTLAAAFYGSRLRLAVLSACESAKTGGDSLLRSIAPSLILAGIPAVVAMQQRLPDEAAARFSCGFYQALLNGYDLEAAMLAGRKQLIRTTFWHVPTLYLRAARMPEIRHAYLERRIDTAGPRTAPVDLPLRFGLWIRRPDSPAPSEEELRRLLGLEPAEPVSRDSTRAPLKFEVETGQIRPGVVEVRLVAPGCDLHSTAAKQMSVFPDFDTPPLWFSLTPRKIGRLDVIFELSQEGRLVATAAHTITIVSRNEEETPVASIRSTQTTLSSEVPAAPSSPGTLLSRLNGEPSGSKPSPAAAPSPSFAPAAARRRVQARQESSVETESESEFLLPHSVPFESVEELLDSLSEPAPAAPGGESSERAKEKKKLVRPADDLAYGESSQARIPEPAPSAPQVDRFESAAKEEPVAPADFDFDEVLLNWPEKPAPAAWEAERFESVAEEEPASPADFDYDEAVSGWTTEPAPAAPEAGWFGSAAEEESASPADFDYDESLRDWPGEPTTAAPEAGWFGSAAEEEPASLAGFGYDESLQDWSEKPAFAPWDADRFGSAAAEPAVPADFGYDESSQGWSEKPTLAPWDAERFGGVAKEKPAVPADFGYDESLRDWPGEPTTAALEAEGFGSAAGEPTSQADLDYAGSLLARLKEFAPVTPEFEQFESADEEPASPADSDYADSLLDRLKEVAPVVPEDELVESADEEPASSTGFDYTGSLLARLKEPAPEAEPVESVAGEEPGFDYDDSFLDGMGEAAPMGEAIGEPYGSAEEPLHEEPPALQKPTTDWLVGGVKDKPTADWLVGGVKDEPTADWLAGDSETKPAPEAEPEDEAYEGAQREKPASPADFGYDEALLNWPGEPAPAGSEDEAYESAYKEEASAPADSSYDESFLDWMADFMPAEPGVEPSQNAAEEVDSPTDFDYDAALSGWMAAPAPADESASESYESAREFATPAEPPTGVSFANWLDSMREDVLSDWPEDDTLAEDLESEGVQDHEFQDAPEQNAPAHPLTPPPQVAPRPQAPPPPGGELPSPTIEQLENLAVHYIQTSQYDWAVEALLQLVEAHQASGQSLALGFALFNLGKTWAKLGRYDQTLPAIIQAMQVFEARDRQEEVIACCIVLAQAYAMLGQQETALRLGNFAVELAGQRRVSPELYEQLRGLLDWLHGNEHE